MREGESYWEVKVVDDDGGGIGEDGRHEKDNGFNINL